MPSGLWIGDAYAHGPGECAPEYAGLWDGLVGCWVPQMGPTGNRLLDLSGYGNHGTLTNMDPATDWVPGPNGWALDFDGSDDYVTCGATHTINTGAFTATLVIRPRNVTLGRYALCGNTLNRPAIIVGYQLAYWNLFTGLYPTGTASHTQMPATVNEWQIVSYSLTTTTVVGVLNGAVLVNRAQSGSASTELRFPMLFATAGGTTRTNMQVAFVAMHSTALQPSAIQYLHTDPLGLLRPRRRWWAVAPTAGRRRLRRYHDRLYAPGLNPGVM